MILKKVPDTSSLNSLTVKRLRLKVSGTSFIIFCSRSLIQLKIAYRLKSMLRLPGGTYYYTPSCSLSTKVDATVPKRFIGKTKKNLTTEPKSSTFPSHKKRKPPYIVHQKSYILSHFHFCAIATTVSNITESHFSVCQAVPASVEFCSNFLAS